MQTQKQSINTTEKWIRCPKCGHKLMKVLGTTSNTFVEIKCSSCKAIVNVKIEKEEQK